MRARWPLAAVLTGMLLTACGQRGPLYIPGKPGDPYYDRQNRGNAPATPPSTQSPGQPAPNSSKPKREEDS